jgi:acetyl esterase/lipase
MDIVYPSKPAHSVPVLMEITCDNQNRMGSFSLLFCHDTLLEGAQAAGFATAMIDHPVAPPYKGLDDPMPQCIYRLKAAVRTLRALDEQIGGNGRIGAIGFSRGGPMAALLAVTSGRAELEGDGAHKNVSSAVQAAMIHGNRYDYLHLSGDDPMIPRFTQAWGPLDSRQNAWAEHGAAHYLSKDAPPMFLNTSDTEAPEFREGLARFDLLLTQLGIRHVYQVDEDRRGHQVTTDPATLSRVYGFFHRELDNKPASP